MKLMQRIVSLLVKPPKRRGFTRVDLIVFLLLGVLIVADLLMHVLQPATAAEHATNVVPMQTSQVKGHTNALAIPAVQASNTSLYTKRQVNTIVIPAVPMTQTSYTSPHVKSQADAPCYRYIASKGGTLKVTVPCPQPKDKGSAPTLLRSDCSVPTDIPTVAPPTLSQNNTVKSPFGTNDILFFFTSPGITVGNCGVQGMQNVMILVVNSFIVIVFVLAGLRIMLSGSVFRYANMIEDLPRILLALLGSNLSLLIVTLFLALNNVMTADFYSTFSNYNLYQAQFNGNDVVTKTCNNWDTLGGAVAGAAAGAAGGPITAVATGIAGAILGHGLGCDVNPHVKNWNQTLQSELSPPKIAGGASTTGLLFLWHSITDVLKDITGTMALMLMGQMAIRLFFIDLYIITAPLGIGCSALPGRGGQQMTQMWLRGFLTILFAQFIQVVGLAIIRILVGAITSDLYASFSAGSLGSAVNNDATLLWIIQIAQYWFLLRIPAVLVNGPMGSPVNMMVSYGQTVAQTVQTSAQAIQQQLQLTLQAAQLVVGAAGTAAMVR